MRPDYLLVCVLGVLASCKSPPRFHQTTLVSSQFDAGNAATKVAIRFEVRDADGLPVSDLTTDNLTIREDGVLATSESHARLDQTRHPIRIALLLDRSASVQSGEALASIKKAAQAILDELAGHPCDIQIYSFANTIERLPNLNQLTTSTSGNVESRWTALYHAVNTVLTEAAFAGAGAETPAEKPAATPTGELGVEVEPTAYDDLLTVLVICTDGADNYSQNFNSPTLADLERFIGSNGIIVHALGFGNVMHEQDRQGIYGVDALRRLASHGSYHNADEPEAIPTLARHILRRIRATYSCEFYSPSLSGEHELTLDIRYGGATGRSKPIRFTAGRSDEN